MEILKVIVLLCQVYNAPKSQLVCQKEYIKCWESKRTSQIQNNKYFYNNMLESCIMEK